MSPALSPAAPALPLQRFALFHSHDVDEARESVARIFCPHLLRPVAPRTALDACHHSATLHRDVSLNYVQYGPCVDIHPGYLKDFFLLQIPLRGGAEVRCGGQQIRADTALASLPSPTEPLAMRWADNSPHLIVKLSRAAMQAQLERLAQAPCAQPLVFELGVRLAEPALAPLLGFIRYLQATLDAADAGAAFTGSLLAEQAEGYLISTLLLCAPHNHSAALRRGSGNGNGRRELLPRSVRRAREFMASRLDSALSLAEVCAHVGVSARALQTAFRAHGGHSPMDFLRDARLDRVRSELGAAAADGDITVAQVAARYGFLHAGRFAAQYALRFGEAPSQTLRRHRH